MKQVCGANYHNSFVIGVKDTISMPSHRCIKEFYAFELYVKALARVLLFIISNKALVFILI